MAARQRHLRNAPITEALIDFRVTPPITVDPNIRGELEARLADRYPVVDTLGLVEAQIRLRGEQPGITRADRFHGFALRTRERDRVVQFRTDGFTFNRLPPYRGWDEMRTEALAAWQVYLDVLAPATVARVATRYINHLTFPPPLGDLSRYLVVPPAAPPDIGYSLVGFLQRLALMDAASGTSAQVTLGLEPSMADAGTTVLLDIDAYRAGEYDVRDDRLLVDLEALHDMKNRIFFGSIEEAAARLWE